MKGWVREAAFGRQYVKEKNKKNNLKKIKAEKNNNHKITLHSLTYLYEDNATEKVE